MLFFDRKETKEHGADQGQRLIGAEDVRGKRIVLLDDVFTGGVTRIKFSGGALGDAPLFLGGMPIHAHCRLKWGPIIFKILSGGIWGEQTSGHVPPPPPPRGPHSYATVQHRKLLDI